MAAQCGGTQHLLRSLQAAGITDIFATPRVPFSSAESSEPVRVKCVLTEHEQGAGHAAEGYAVATGRVGVCVVPVGHGLTNLVTALADAHMDSVPVLAVAVEGPPWASIATSLPLGDVMAMTMGITKHNVLVDRTEDIQSAIATAYRRAETGRPGPVLVVIAWSAMVGRADLEETTHLEMAGVPTALAPDNRAVERAAALVHASERPVYLVGGGVIRAGASADLALLVAQTQIPVVTTLMARGALAIDNPLHYGMPGMHGSVAAVAALQKADLIISLGARFDNRVTGSLDHFAPSARIVHVDIDSAEIGKNLPTDVEIHADARLAIQALTVALGSEPALRTERRRKWIDYLTTLSTTYPVSYTAPGDGSLAPQFVLERIREVVGDEAIFTSGVGQHQMWAAHYLRHPGPTQWINSGGLGTMGFAIPAALGAKVGRPDVPVWAVDGDGCFQMTARELIACATQHIPIKVAVLNNESLGMVRQLQSLYYDGRVAGVALQGPEGSKSSPDIAALADSLGCVGLQCDRPEDVDFILNKAVGINDAPVVIDFRVHRDEMVWPAVADGASYDDLKYAKDLSPQFEADDI